MKESIDDLCSLQDGNQRSPDSVHVGSGWRPLHQTRLEVMTTMDTLVFAYYSKWWKSFAMRAPMDIKMRLSTDTHSECPAIMEHIPSKEEMNLYGMAALSKSVP